MTPVSSDRPPLTADQIEQWNHDGYLIIPSLFETQEIEQLKNVFQAIADKGEPVPGWSPAVEADHSRDQGRASAENPGAALKRYPRYLHPHRYLDQARDMLLDLRVRDVLVQLIHEEMVACQSMYYFKPCGAKGQALHQDNLYLRVEPQTCYAAWVAIDPVTQKNGGLHVVPGTHRLDTQCPDQADEQESFTTHRVNIPANLKAVPANMKPGDVLFFNGQIIHGSGMNRSKTQWRRSFICHYMPKSSRCVSEFYFPILGFDGSVLTYKASQSGGPCGPEFTDRIPSSYQGK